MRVSAFVVSGSTRLALVSIRMGGVGIGCEEDYGPQIIEPEVDRQDRGP
jgi:hypothetical protein